VGIGRYNRCANNPLISALEEFNLQLLALKELVPQRYGELLLHGFERFFEESVKIRAPPLAIAMEIFTLMLKK